MARVTLDNAYNKEIHSTFLRSLNNAPSNFIASKIAPYLPVKKDNGELLNYGKQAMRVIASGRAVGGRYKRIDFDVEKTNEWKLQDHGLFSYVYNEEVENADSIINAEQDKLVMLNEIMNLNFEEAVSSVVNTSNIANNATLSGTSQWSDYTNSDPVQVIETKKEVIRAATGKIPNSIALGRSVFVQLKRHPKVLELIKYANVVTDKMLEQVVLRDLLGFENIAIGAAVYNDVNLGGTDNVTDIWGKRALMYYSNPNPGRFEDVFAMTCKKKDGPVAGAFKTTDEQRNTQGIVSGVVASNKYDILLVNTDLAFLWEDAVA